MPNKKLEFLVGIPSKKEHSAFFDAVIDNWLINASATKTKSISNRVDFNRNLIWERAKQLDTSLIFVDTDIEPNTPFKQVREYAYEDFAEGYDVVFAPTLEHTGRKPLFHAPSLEDYGKEEPYEVYNSSFGFTVISKRLIRELEPLTQVDMIKDALDDTDFPDDSKEKLMIEIKKNTSLAPIVYAGTNNRTPVYMTHTALLGEDNFFCKRVRELGYKLAIDPRIKVTHNVEIQMQYDAKRFKKALEIKKQEEQEESQKAIDNKIKELDNE